MSATTEDNITNPAGKFWLASYPPDTPGEIAPLSHVSIGALVDDCCARFAERPAFTCMGKTLTFADLEVKSRHVAAWLQARNLVKGDRVAVMMPNILQNPVIIFGILRAGLTVVNVNPLYTPRELEHQLKDAGAKAIFVLENFAHTVEQVVARTDVKTICVAAMGDMLGLKGLIVNLVVRRVKKLVPPWSLPGHVGFQRALAEGAGLSLKPVAVGHDDTAFLQYTGGTTGVSKGATLTHANLLSNMEQIKLWIEPTFRVKRRPPQLVFVCALPLYHIFALTVNGLMGLALGGHNILIPNPRDIPAFVKELGKYEFHIFPGLNTLFNAMMNNPDFGKLDFSHLVLTLGGGMAVQRPVAERWQAMTHCAVIEGYGLSETSPVATANRFDLPQFTGTILQRPPIFSALKIDGERAYDLARAGEAVELQPREIDVDAIRLIDHGAEQSTLEVTCGKGTYVRSLARDIAEALGTRGHVSLLHRAAVGPFHDADAVTIEQLEALDGAERDALLKPVWSGFTDLPEIRLDPHQASAVRHGNAVLLTGAGAPASVDECWASFKGEVLATGSVEFGQFQPRRVFNL